MTETFPIIPAEGRVLWILAAFVGLLMLGVVLVLIATARGAAHSRFDISVDGLRLRGDLYGRFVPAAAIRGGEVRIVNLAAAAELAPRSRTAGTAVPGYRSGWFRLQNGEKALLYLTAGDRAVYVPTTEGFSLLLSAQEPERFVERLRAITN
ncbi:MAG: PH domain-containing protein [Gemmatimonadaceae bacterium]